MAALLITQEEIDGLPEDPQQRFVGIEAICRKRLYEQIEHEEQWGAVQDARLRYMGTVIASAKYLRIKPFADMVLPTRQKFKDDVYENFIQELEFYIVQLMLQNSENANQTAVLLEGTLKQRLQTLVAHMHLQIAKLDLPPGRIDKLRMKLAEFERELENPRMRIVVWAGVALVVVGILADAGGAASTVRELWNEIEEAVGVAKETQDAEAATKIPAPPVVKLIEGPVREVTKIEDFSRGGDFDDEIPF